MNKYIIKMGTGFYDGQSIFLPGRKSKAKTFDSKKDAERAISGMNRILPAHEAVIIKI